MKKANKRAFQLFCYHTQRCRYEHQTLCPQDKHSSCYAQKHKKEKAKILKMAIIEPFEQYYIQYDNCFEKKRFAYQSGLVAIKDFIPVYQIGIEIGFDPSPKTREIVKNYGL